MPRPARVDSQQIVNLRAAGLPYGEIAKRVGCNKSTAHYWCNQLQVMPPDVKDVHAFATVKAVEMGYPDLVTALADLALSTTCTALAELFGVKFQTMWSWLRRYQLRAGAPVAQPEPVILPDDQLSEPAKAVQARWQAFIDRVPDPQPAWTNRPIKLAVGERWCRACGEVLWRTDEKDCPRCAGTDMVDPRQVLKPEEWEVAT